MKKSSKILLTAVVAVGLFGAAGFVRAQGDKGETMSGTWRYKVTVSVDTPEGIKTGEAVREVTITRGVALTPESTPKKESKGEAVVVDLGKRGLLFALTSFDDYRQVFKAFPYSGGGTTAAGIDYYSHLKKAKAEIPSDIYPIFATFVDPQDPKSIQKVYPESFAEKFGKGVQLKSVTLEMTNEPVTNKIIQYLPSYGKETNFWEWFKKLSYSDSRRIGPDAFKMGVEK